MEQQLSHSKATNYERIFNPKRLAIIGISSKGTGAACERFNALQRFGYQGEVLFVNPKGGELAGQTIYTSVQEVPGEFDLAAIFVKAASVPEILEACRLKGAAVAEVFSSGFSESRTDVGSALEREISQIAKRGIRVIGPNCMGIYCPEGGVTIGQGGGFPKESGPVAFLSQSGGHAIEFTNAGKSIGLTYSKVVSFGNGVDLRETELLRYFGEDPKTRIINMYVEGVIDGDAFVKTCKEAATKKPVIVLKGGISDSGSRAAFSHTASMGGNRKIWQSILRQVNAVQVRDVHEMARANLAFSCLPARTSKNISLVSGGGGMGVAGADTAEAFGLKVPPFAPELAQRIDAFLPKPGSSAGNPIDMAFPIAPPQMFKDVLSLAATDERIDLQVLITMFSAYFNSANATGKSITKEAVPYDAIAESVREAVNKTGKPIVAVLFNSMRGWDDLAVLDMIESTRRAFVERGIPAYDTLSDAMQAIEHVNTYYGRKRYE